MSRNNTAHIKGNALFLILIAVALFAALSYAVTQSGRGGGTIDKEQTILTASQLTQYGAAMKNAAMRMVLTGMATTANLKAANSGTVCTTGEECIFASEGGAIAYQTPPGGYLWMSHNEIAPGIGWTVTGVGSATGIEVLIWAYDMQANVCSQINKGLGLGTAINATVAGDSILGGTGTVDAYPGEAFACYDTTYGALWKNAYYHVLIAQ